MPVLRSQLRISHAPGFGRLVPSCPGKGQAPGLDKQRDPPFAAADYTILQEYRSSLDRATKFIPTWVKASVALALGLGTMIGWKRIVVTVGENRQDSPDLWAGSCAELVAMGTIGAADVLGLPVSTAHVLSSGVAGTMAGNRSALQWSTVRHLLMAWVLTLPASVLLSGGLFWLFRQMIQLGCSRSNGSSV